MVKFSVSAFYKIGVVYHYDSFQIAGTGTTNSEATRAQGDDNIEDTENTEHDISGAGESLEPSSDAHPNEVSVTSRI